jgi:hypothetical protein
MLAVQRYLADLDQRTKDLSGTMYHPHLSGVRHD